jgi:hypothetical protein
MRSQSAIKPVVSLLFGGLLLCSWWLDERGSSAGIAADDARLGFQLVESAEEAGIRFQHRQTSLHPSIANVESQVAALGASVSVTDVNGDGWPDIFSTNSAFGSPNALFLNQGDGSFRDVAPQAGLADLNREGASMGSVWGDIDNYGDVECTLNRVTDGLLSQFGPLRTPVSQSGGQGFNSPFIHHRIASSAQA